MSRHRRRGPGTEPASAIPDFGETSASPAEPPSGAVGPDEDEGPLRPAGAFVAGRGSGRRLDTHEALPREHESLRLAELLREDLVRRPLRATDQWEAVDELIRLVVSRREVPAGLAADARAAVREREAIRPTGWKYGLAFPNGRVVGLKRMVAAIGVSPGGVDFACRDGLPARIIVLVLLPEACYSRFAQGIEALRETFEDATLREGILSARTAAEVVEAVEDAESRELA